MPFCLLLAALAGAGVSGEAVRHPFSVSRLEIHAADDGVSITFRPHGRTLAEIERLGLDTDSDGNLSREELAAGWPALRKYLEDGLRLEVDGVEWRPRFADYEVEPLPDVLGGAAALHFLRLKVSDRLQVAARPARIVVESELFFDDGNPDHTLTVVLHGFGPRPLRHALTRKVRRLVHPPSATGAGGGEPEGAFSFYGRMGWEHVLAGKDHLAFLLALLLGIQGLGSLLAAVTAFTLAHSLTLALAALDVFSLPPSVVEPGIAGSVLFVTWMHALQGTGRARPWLAAFPFGLLHGFGFAGALGEIGIPAGEVAPALLGFNLGVEAGQLTFLLPVVIGLMLAGRSLDATTRLMLRGLATAAIGAAGLQFTAVAVTDAWLTTALSGIPGPLRSLPAGLVLLGILAGWLRGKRTAEGESLAPALRLSATLWLLYMGGAFFGGSSR